MDKEQDNLKSTKQKPLLSDEEWNDIFFSTSIYSGPANDIIVNRVQAKYEDLITSGKLRVVEEVELDATIRGFLMCPKCKRDMREDEWNGWEFCTCGNKIKQ